MPDLASLALRSPAPRDLPVRPTTSRSSFQRSPLHSLRSRGVHTYLHVSVPASETGCQPIPRSIYVVFHHLDGLLLLDPLRILHRSSSHGVRGVSSSAPPLSSSRGPALRSFDPRTQQATIGWRTILAPGRRHPPSFLDGSPPALPPRPCCLDLEALLHVRSRLPYGVATTVFPPKRARCSLGLVRIPVLKSLRIHRSSPLSWSDSGLAGSRRLDHNRSG